MKDRVIAECYGHTYELNGWKVPTGMNWIEFCDYRVQLGFSKPLPLTTIMKMSKATEEYVETKKRRIASNKKVTRDQELEILRKRLDGASYPQIGEEFKVSKVAISYICNGRNWSEVLADDAEYVSLLDKVKEYNKNYRRSSKKQWRESQEAFMAEMKSKRMVLREKV